MVIGIWNNVSSITLLILERIVLKEYLLATQVEGELRMSHSFGITQEAS